MHDGRDMARISPDDVVSLAAKAAAGSDAVFISGTAVLALGVTDRIAAAWQAARLCGVTAALAPAI